MQHIAQPIIMVKRLSLGSNVKERGGYVAYCIDVGNGFHNRINFVKSMSRQEKVKGD